MLKYRWLSAVDGRWSKFINEIVEGSNIQEIIETFVFLAAMYSRTYELVYNLDGDCRAIDFRFMQTNTICAVDHFAETRTIYRVKTVIEPLHVESTAELSPFLKVAEELEREFGALRA